VDVLVNNAGLYTTTPLLAIDERSLLEALQVNLIGAWRTSRVFVPAMRQRGWGRVVNVSTGDAHFTERPPTAGAYSLAKAGLNVLTRIVAAEAGPQVKVNCVSPGWVATRMGGAGAPASVEEGADTAVWLATVPDDGPTDGFYYRRDRIPEIRSGGWASTHRRARKPLPGRSGARAGHDERDSIKRSSTRRSRRCRGSASCA
jgi:NAD(P)-dependent dehydrogenase (short-subunit alcohol dehydrogenase family)